ncbi:hypothetical protein DEO72_LG3g669 [Vigna unguiculata]|uniref:Uncharacterized protein n=1 Tax=Vigna unguiculata TaxID=3917 RepID=A0A4D6LC63_VIGUN|nr:hypothetical protein DEO72_LG3g669 [Vigna unguiculata]
MFCVEGASGYLTSLFPGERRSPKRARVGIRGWVTTVVAQARDLTFGRGVGSLRRGRTRLMHNSLGSLGEILRVVLQWSGRNFMAPDSGCSWWSPIYITWGEQLGGEQRYPPQVQASAESDQLTLLLVGCFVCCPSILAMIINLLMGADERVTRGQQRRDDSAA